MNPKTTAILFAIAAALAAFVYFYEIKGEEARVGAKAAEDRLFPDLEQGEIAAISLRASEAPEIRLERRNDRWRISEPIDYAADEFATDGIASAITQLRRESVIDDPRPPEVYGLVGEGSQVRFAVGDSEKTFRIGSATPVGSNVYVSVDGDDRIYTVPSYQLSSFKKKLEDFRDKRILEFDEAGVSRVSAEWPDAKVEIERTDTDWKMVEPVASPADVDTVESLLSSLSFLRAAAFVDEPPSDAEMGLEPPQFAVALDLMSDSEGAEPHRVRLEIGGVDEAGSRRFARSGAGVVYLISQESLDGFPRRVVEYRDRWLATFPAGDASRVELGFHTPNGETFAVRVERDDGRWVSDADPVEQSMFDALVDALSELRADDIVAERLGAAELQAMGLDPARIVLQVYGGGASAERLAEIQLGVAFGDGVTARADGRETIFLIGASAAEAIPLALDDYRERFVEQPEPVADDGGPDAGALEPVADGEAGDASP